MLVASAATIFGAAYPVVVPSTIDAAFDVTVADASVSDYTLTVMTWAAGVRAAGRARLPGLDLLGVPQAADRRAGARAEPRRGARVTARGRGPLGALAGVPGLTGALVRAAVAALAQTAGLVLLAAGLAHAVARATGLADGGLVPAAGGGRRRASALRAVAGTVGEVLAARDARRAEDRLRRDAARPARPPPPPRSTAAGGPGPAAVLATTRLHDLGPALATYLPALAQTLVVPPVLLLVLAATDLLSAVLVAVTLPLVPLFMVLVGKYTRDARPPTPPGRWTGSPRTSPSWCAGCRCWSVSAAPPSRPPRSPGSARRTAPRTLATLRIAFLSALVLELIATLSVALVAVTVGLRLVDGDLALAVGLTALLLAPEAFAPLRALGSAHHAVGGRRAGRRRGARGARRRPSPAPARRRPRTTTPAAPTSPSAG